MWEKLQRLLDRLESRLALWLLFAASPLAALMTGWIAYLTTALGPLGWVFSGLAAFVLLTLGIFLLSLVRAQTAKREAMQKWAREVDRVNPMDAEFRNQRIKLRDLAHPTTHKIEKKKFYNCELLGPDNLLFFGKGMTTNGRFEDCVTIVLYFPPNERLDTGGAIVAVECEFYNCTFFGLTLLIPPPYVPHFVGMNALFATLTGVPEIDRPRIEGWKKFVAPPGMA